MLKKDMPERKNIWAVTDLGDVIYDDNREWINNEFPTQAHIQLCRIGDVVHVGNDDLSIISENKVTENVDVIVMAFNEMLETIIRLQAE